MRKTRRRFTREFKIETVRLVTDRGHSLSQVARDLDLDPKMLRRWKKELVEAPEEAFPGKGQLRLPDEEIRQLQRELARVRQERDILKKVVAIFSAEPR